MIFKTREKAQAFIDHFKLGGAVPLETTHGHWTIGPEKWKSNPPQACSICGQQFREYSNNAQPVNDGRCCRYCDKAVVEPARTWWNAWAGGLLEPELVS